MKFTIRDLLWLTVVVALGVGWWVRERQMRINLAERDGQWKSAMLYALDSEGKQGPIEVALPNGKTIYVMSSSLTAREKLMP